jgi:hypothetical protein
LFREVRDSGNSQTAGIDCHQDGAVLEIGHGFEHCRDLGGTQDYRLFFFVPRVRDVFDHLVEDVVIEEAQSAHCLIEQRPRDLLLLNQEQLVLPDVFRSEPIRGESEELRKLRDAADVNRIVLGE